MSHINKIERFIKYENSKIRQFNIFYDNYCKYYYFNSNELIFFINYILCFKKFK